MERWWSRRFARLLESFADPDRLADRQGTITQLRVDPCEVVAKVRVPGEVHDLTVGIGAIDELGWRRVEDELASRAVFRAKLLAGEVPPEIELVFAEAGLPLLPMSAGALHLMCSCDDYGEPCPHAATVLDALGRAFDQDPFLILEWNGRSRDALLTALRRAPAADPDPFEVEEEPLTADGYWAAPSGLARLRERRAAPPVPPGFVLEIAEPPAVKVRRRALVDVLLPAYEALAENPSSPEE
ncbi:SWIM zinc finger family protein [Actinomadura parmotrematis]|uniref:SWIM-type domain-containing protein n=1 Tax=Actinomadura parmotrematis TaxID=2864039 RepID=A0ABS7FXZ2_9ACTN|nr:hypothetical protein [Actinomadura parmotrematis]MBW8484467.1 hypothetical protein [Actinomadura parmotrematis]